MIFPPPRGACRGNLLEVVAGALCGYTAPPATPSRSIMAYDLAPHFLLPPPSVKYNYRLLKGVISLSIYAAAAAAGDEILPGCLGGDCFQSDGTSTVGLTKCTAKEA